MTYNDTYNFPYSQIMKSDLDAIQKAPFEDKPHVFIDYCKKVIVAKSQGEMPLRDAAYSIARTMFINELENPLFEEITLFAGELELPTELVEGDLDKKWGQLVALVDEYGKTHRKASG